MLSPAHSWDFRTQLLHQGTRNVAHDHFNLTVVEWPSLDTVTKRLLAYDVAKTYDVLGWFAPTTISMKIVTANVGTQAGPVPQEIRDTWHKWKSELSSLATKLPHNRSIDFSDVSEDAYSTSDTQGAVHTSLPKLVLLLSVNSPLCTRRTSASH